jgi:predicted ferric reductase
VLVEPATADPSAASAIDPPAAPWLAAQAVRQYLLLAVGLGAVAATCWPIEVALRDPQPTPPVGLVAHLTGMLAGYGALVLLVLMARAPALERGIGADMLARWHAHGGRLVVTLVVVHAWAAVVAWGQTHREDLVVSLWHVLRLPWLVAATVGTGLLLAVAATSVRAVRRGLSYEAWHAVHLLTYGGVGLSFLHQLAGPDLTGRPMLQLGWGLLSAYVFALLLGHRFLTPLRQATRHRLRVHAVVPEGRGVVSIEVEGRHLTELQAEPGQFFRWRFLTRDTWRSAHPFSLSAPPNDTRLRLTVKALGEGSGHLQRVPVGTRVVAAGPYGAMTAARRTRRNVLLIAGGVGITPLRALFETLPLDPGQDLTLLYRARSPEHVLFRHELDEIAGSRDARVHYLLGCDPECLSATAMLRLVPDLPQRDVYLCGPPRMSAAVRDSLRAAGLPVQQLHEERFAF